MANNAYIHMDATDFSASKKSYIDLNYVPTLTTNVEITMKYDSAANRDYGDTYLFGMNGNLVLYSPSGGYGARIRTGLHPDYYFEPTYGGNFKDRSWLMPNDTDFTIRFDQTTVSGKFTMYANGTVAQQWDLASSLQNLSLFLFATNNNNSSYTYACPDEWVKEIKIYEGSTLVRNYVPREQNGVVGLKDKVLGIFYAPTGTGKMVMEGTATPVIITNPLPAQPHKQTVMFNTNGWKVPYIPEPIICPEPVGDDRFYLEAVEASTIGLSSKSSGWTTFEYSTDNGTTWSNFTTSTSISLAAGEKAYFRAIQTGDSTSNYGYTAFNLTRGKFNVGGNIMYLYDYEHLNTNTVSYRLAFHMLFTGNTSYKGMGIINANELVLPATTLTGVGCYSQMFQYNTALVTAPRVLPATTLAESCYLEMFRGCSSLIESPVLQATTLAVQSYNFMFFGCSSLNKVTSYAQDISATDCTTYWLNLVKPNGDFYNLGGAAYSSDYSGIPSSWTEHTSL